MVEDVQAATRRLCHSQLSWFRGEAAFTWVDAAPPAAEVAAAVAAQLAGGGAPAGARSGCMPDRVRVCERCSAASHASGGHCGRGFATPWALLMHAGHHATIGKYRRSSRTLPGLVKAASPSP